MVHMCQLDDPVQAVLYTARRQLHLFCTSIVNMFVRVDVGSVERLCIYSRGHCSGI